MTATEELLRETFRARASDVSPPVGLAATVISTDRRQRRQRLTLAAAAAALLVLVVAVVVPLQFLPDSTSAVAPGDAYPFPPRGSLADDAEFLAAALRAPWGRGPDALDPPPDTRQVVFAGEVPGDRWARVVGLVDGGLWGVWFATGPNVAPPRFYLLAEPTFVDLDLDIFSDFSNSQGPVVMIGRPGDDFEISDRPEVDARGQVQRTFRPVDTVDGVGLVSRPGSGRAALRLLRDGRSTVVNDMGGGVGRGGIRLWEEWDEAAFVAASQTALGSVDPDLARHTLMSLEQELGLTPEQLRPQVLWGSVDAFPGLLLAAWLPSGAVAVVGSCGTAANSALRLMQFYPAGTDPAQLLLVMPCPDLTLDGPGSAIDHLVVLEPVGTERVRLDDGGASVEVQGGSRVGFIQDENVGGLRDFRALDADGNVLARAEIGTVVDLGP